MLIRRALVFLREKYKEDAARLYLSSGFAVFLMAAVTFGVDLLLPFEGMSNLLRSFLLIPGSISIFVLAYAIGLKLHFSRVEADETWVPYRARFSPAWRLRISVVVGAVLIVIAQAMSETVGYTFSSSCIGAAALATWAFLRRSNEEIKREELGIPDARDIIYDAQKRQFEREKALKEAAKKETKGNKSRRKKKSDLD